MQNQNFDTLAVGVLDFKTHVVETFQYNSNKGVFTDDLYFDLASMTKPLTMGAAFLLHEKLRTPLIQMLIEHRAGLPAWAILSRDNWREHVLSFSPKESPTEYSDLSALRVMLEMEKVSGESLKEMCSSYWDKELLHWFDLKSEHRCVDTGYRQGHIVNGEVHDPNAFNIQNFCSHAGMFGTVAGVCKSLLNLDREGHLLKTMNQNLKKKPESQRYCWGWDSIQDSATTLAGPGASVDVFGHLGFTGTSMWIDSLKARGIIILSNSTQHYWYQKEGINHIRRTLGSQFWESR